MLHASFASLATRFALLKYHQQALATGEEELLDAWEESWKREQEAYRRRAAGQLFGRALQWRGGAVQGRLALFSKEREHKRMRTDAQDDKKKKKLDLFSTESLL